MTTYERILNKFQSVAGKINPTGTNLHGTYMDLGLQEAMTFPVIQLLMPFTITENRDRSGADAELLFFFGRPDKFEANEIERQTYVDEMMKVADHFVTAWDDADPLIGRSSQIRMEPLFKVGRDSLTGCGAMFTVQVSGC
jgi:hypothetical protein